MTLEQPLEIDIPPRAEVLADARGKVDVAITTVLQLQDAAASTFPPDGARSTFRVRPRRGTIVVPAGGEIGRFRVEPVRAGRQPIYLYLREVTINGRPVDYDVSLPFGTVDVAEKPLFERVQDALKTTQGIVASLVVIVGAIFGAWRYLRRRCKPPQPPAGQPT